MKITLKRDGQHKNNSPKGWTDGELHDRHDNNSLKGLTAQKQIAQRDGWIDSWMVAQKLTRQMMENWMVST